MNSRSSTSHRNRKLALFLAVGGTAFTGVSAPLLAQQAIPVPVPLEKDAPAATTDAAATVRPRHEQAAQLIDEAITVARRNPTARPALARGAAALLPKLDPGAREEQSTRWLDTISNSSVSRGAQLAALSSFFGVLSRNGGAEDLAFGRELALTLPDATARTGAFIQLSEAASKTSWDQASELARLAQRAARQETNPRLRARALAYVAARMAVIDPAERTAAVVEASTYARRVTRSGQRDVLLAEVVGAAAKFDIGLAQRVATGIENENFKNLATARIAVAQLQSGFAVKKPDADRIAEIVQGVPRYDTSFIPVLLQLPPSPAVFEALGDALPMIYPDAPLAIEANTLERVWNYAESAEEDVYRDQLLSRVARLMVLHDLWHGREWGRQLPWEGGRNQIARFVDETVKARESRLHSEQLREQTLANVNDAILSTRQFRPSERVEGLLLIAGQLLA